MAERRAGGDDGDWHEYRRLLNYQLSELQSKQESILTEISAIRSEYQEAILSEEKRKALSTLIEKAPDIQEMVGVYVKWMIFWRLTYKGALWSGGIIAVMWAGHDLIWKIIVAVWKVLGT